jgi:hypothetical protein
MAIQTINIGNQVNDGLGDDLRTAFQKVNANFTELQSALTITASNIGQTGFGVFKQKTGVNLEFKNLVASTKILLTEQPNSIVISSTQPDAFTTITTDVGIARASEESDITLQGGDNISVVASGSTITVDSILDLNQILLNFDFGPITGLFVNPTQLALQAANIDFGTVDIPGRLDLDLGTL